MVGCGESKEERAAVTKPTAENKAVAVPKEVQCRFCGNIFPANAIHPHELRCPKNDTDQQIRKKPTPSNPKTTSEKLIADPIVEKAVRKSLRKPEGQLTEADLKKVTGLSLDDTQITDAGLKELAKCKQLEKLHLGHTQITDTDALRKALPKCKIGP